MFLCSAVQHWFSSFSTIYPSLKAWNFIFWTLIFPFLLELLKKYSLCSCQCTDLLIFHINFVLAISTLVSISSRKSPLLLARYKIFVHLCFFLTVLILYWSPLICTVISMHIFETQLMFIHLYFLPVDLKMKKNIWVTKCFISKSININSDPMINGFDL